MIQLVFANLKTLVISIRYWVRAQHLKDYRHEFTFRESMGARFEGPDRQPVCNPETLESNVPRIFLAGVIVAGSRTNEIFIENGRFHGKQIARALLSN
jgi:thioredoxin reductase (NADPH)